MLATLGAAIEIPLRYSVPTFLGAHYLFLEGAYSLLIAASILLSRGLVPLPTLGRTSSLWPILIWPAALPIGLLTPVFFGNDPSAAPFSAMLSLNRFLLIPYAVRIMSRWRLRHILNPGIFRLLVFAFWTGVFSHWTACGWIAITGAQDSSALDAYVAALYWTVTTLTTVGYGDIVPQHNLARIYTMCVMIAGVASWGYVVGNIASILSSLDVIRARHLHRLEEMNAFLRYRSVPDNLQHRVNEYFRHVWDNRMTLDEGRMLEQLPPELAEDLALLMHRDLIRKVPIFRNADAALVRAIVRRLRPTVVTPGTHFIRKGEVADSMYFISNGQVEVVSEDEDTVFATLHEGDFVGETALVHDVPRTETVRAKDYCDLYVLSRRDFDECLRDHPEFAEHIRAVSAERMQRVRDRGRKGG